MARLRVTTVLWLALALSGPRAGAVSLWELATRDRSAAARVALASADADALLYELRARNFPLGQGASQGLLQELVGAYEHAIAIDPRSAPALGALARIEERLGRHEHALECAERALELSPWGPGAPETLFTLALIHTRLLRFEDARDAYLRELVFTLDAEERAVVYGNLGDTYVSLEDLPNAISAYRSAVSAQPTPMAWLGLAVTLDRDGRDDAVGAADHAASAAIHARSARHAALHGAPRSAPDFWGLMNEIANPNVFFVPAYDRYYYEAIALEAVARAAAPQGGAGLTAVDASTDPALDARHRALTSWELYLRVAPSGDRWRPRAQGHLRGLQSVPRARRPRGAASRGPVVM